MIKLVYCIRRNPALSEADFRDYWLNNHVPLVKKLSPVLGVFRYVQNHVYDSPVADASNAARGCALTGFDGITELWWRSEAEMQPAGISRETSIDCRKQLLADERKFIDVENSITFMVEEHIIFDEPA